MRQLSMYPRKQYPAPFLIFTERRVCQNESTMAFVLGIDGGGSKTAAAISNGISVFATHASKGCNLNSVSTEFARQSIAEAVHGALALAGISANDIASVCAGVAGAASP